VDFEASRSRCAISRCRATGQNLNDFRTKLGASATGSRFSFWRYPKCSTLAEVRAKRASLPGDNPPLTYDDAARIVRPGDPFLRQMTIDLSLHAWENTAEDLRRLEAVLVVLAHKRTHRRRVLDHLSSSGP
jgi:hypothetical protein